MQRHAFVWFVALTIALILFLANYDVDVLVSFHAYYTLVYYHFEEHGKQ